MRFAYPYFLLFLLIIPLILWIRIKYLDKKTSFIRFSDIALIKKSGVYKNDWSLWLLTILRMAVIFSLVIALARPQGELVNRQFQTRGIDIIICLDTSTSMLAMDFKPDRLKGAVEKAIEFVKQRPNDRIGLVVFAAESFTQCPLTLDHSALINLLTRVDETITKTDGTAIGTAIATCVSRLKDSDAKSKVIILLTDGRNNTGKIDPETAAKMARTLGIKIYAVGMGKKGKAPYPVKDPMYGSTRIVYVDEDLDEETLKNIAYKTNGAYFRATDNESLGEIYKKIDQMEKIDIKTNMNVEYKELYPVFILIGLIMLLLEIFLSQTYLRKIP